MAAINEIKASSSPINDGATNTASSWSSQKITDELLTTKNATKNELINGAAAAYDTLAELAAEIQANDTDLIAILAAQNKRVAVDAVQTFTAGERDQALANIGAQKASDIGNTDTDFLAIYTTNRA